MNILFYGNCQINAIFKTLNFSNKFNIYNIHCWIDDIEQLEFTSIINKCDIIITQPISDNYRNKTYLSTSYIIQNKKSECKIIIMDSCYFDFYYFDLTYQTFNNDTLHYPIDYHYKEMINCYNNNKPVDYYIDNFVNNSELKTSEELEKIAKNSLTELYNRYINTKTKFNNNNVHVLSIYEYIKQNYKDKLLFYSMNHPTKYVIQFICEEITNILQIENTINYDIDVLNHPKCILYKCISKNINFDINNHDALTLNITDVNKITQLYYDTYTNIGFK